MAPNNPYPLVFTPLRSLLSQWMGAVLSDQERMVEITLSELRGQIIGSVLASIFLSWITCPQGSWFLGDEDIQATHMERN